MASRGQASLPLPALFRSRQWQLRLVIPALFGYLAGQLWRSHREAAAVTTPV